MISDEAQLRVLTEPSPENALQSAPKRGAEKFIPSSTARDSQAFDQPRPVTPKSGTTIGMCLCFLSALVLVLWIAVELSKKTKSPRSHPVFCKRVQIAKTIGIWQKQQPNISSVISQNLSAFGTQKWTCLAEVEDPPRHRQCAHDKQNLNACSASPEYLHFLGKQVLDWDGPDIFSLGK